MEFGGGEFEGPRVVDDIVNEKDDRNLRGQLHELIRLDATIGAFDTAACLTTQHDKT